MACSSLEYGGIRAATSRTPAPRRLLFLSPSLHRSSRFPTLSLSLFTRSPSSLPHLSSLSLLFPQEHWYSPAVPFRPPPPYSSSNLEACSSFYPTRESSLSPRSFDDDRDDSSSLQYNQQNLRHAKNRGFYAPKDIFEQLFPNLSHCSQCL